MPNGVTFAVWMLISDVDKLSMAMVACDVHIFIIIDRCVMLCVLFSRVAACTVPYLFHLGIMRYVLLILGNWLS